MSRALDLCNYDSVNDSSPMNESMAGDLWATAI